MKIIDLLEYNLNQKQKQNALNNKATIVVKMPPEMFLALTTDSSDMQYVKDKSHVKQYYQDLIDKEEIIVHPFLSINEKTGKVVAHEGRSRAFAAMMHGDKFYETSVEIYPPSRQLSIKDVPDVWIGQFDTKYKINFKHLVENGTIKIVDDNVQRQYQKKHINESLDVDYYMNEGCGVYALKLAKENPGGKIWIISNPDGEKWSKSIPFEVTHVVYQKDRKLFDATGETNEQKIKDYFHLDDFKIYGPYQPEEFKKKFIGTHDRYPLFGESLKKDAANVVIINSVSTNRETFQEQLLKEKISSPLYHVTTIDILKKILKDNKLKANTYQYISGKIIQGISTTRDFQVAKRIARGKSFANNKMEDKPTPIIIKLDSNKISNNKKILPVDFFTTHPDQIKKDEKFSDVYLNTRRRQGNRNESEEFIVGDLTNIKNYIMDILDKTGHSVLKQNQEFLETIEESWQRISGDKTNFQPANKDIDIQYGVTDFSHGQLDGYVAAYDTSKPKKFRDPIHGEANHMCVGLLNWSEYQGKVLIKFVQVIPEYQKQRIALCLLSRLQREFPKAEIDFGYVTGEGKALMESKSAPLYHCTGVDHAASIIQNNALHANTVQIINGQEIEGVSLTRSMSFAKTFSNYSDATRVIFVIDQQRLDQRYKILPLDYFSTNPYSKDPKNQRRQGQFAEAEEFVLGNISHLDRYITKIILPKSTVAFVEKIMALDSDGLRPHSKQLVDEYLVVKNNPKTVVEK